MSAPAHAPVRITDIGTLVVVPPGPVSGPRMCALRTIHDAVLTIRHGRIAWFGIRTDAPPLESGEQAISADGGCVVPGLIDPHTHIGFVGERSGEFVRRIGGETYLSILESGGGIRVTSQAVRAATHEQIVAENLPRLRRMIAGGVTTIECKSGYGLTVEDELKQLLAIQTLAKQLPIDIVATYLGAHAIPQDFDHRADAFIDWIGADSVFEEIQRNKLARFADVFCDRGAFTVAQARTYLERARRRGLGLKLHADELAQIGASMLAAELGATSADHLEHVDDASLAAMRYAGVIPVVLPGTSFFLGITHANARKMIDAGLPLALGTDFNPGSCTIESLPLIMNIACCQLRLLPNEALVACTANAAAALDLHTIGGAIEPGFDADLLILDVPSINHWMYAIGHPAIRTVIKRGHIVHSANS